MPVHTSFGILLHLFAVDRNSVSPAGTYTYMSPKRVGNKVCISVLRHASASLLTLGAWECHQGGAGARRQYRNCAADVQLRGLGANLVAALGIFLPESIKTACVPV